MSRRRFLQVGAGGVGVLGVAGGSGTGYLVHRVQRIGRYPEDSIRTLHEGGATPLFVRYPGIASRLPWSSGGRYPTEIDVLPLDGSPAGSLLVKRDDLASPLYGGNKLRKLEHLLAEAKLAGADTLITVGAIGSNHALATALHGRAKGFRVEIKLFDQPVTPFVRRNLRGFLAAGAGLEYGGGIAGALLASRRAYSRALREGRAPYFVNAGGTSRLGTIGYVNAALELADQVRAGVVREPDRIFVPLGTCGTAAGLVAGFRLAGLRTRVTAVRVAEWFPANAVLLRYFAQDVVDWLHAADPLVPHVRIRFSDFDVHTGELGRGYGIPTDAGLAAIEWAAPWFELESTYSAKALAACLDHCRSTPETVMFWNTYNSSPFAMAESLDALPSELHRVFEG